MEFTTQEEALVTRIKSDAETLIQEKTSGLITETKFTEKMNELKTSNDNVSKELQTKIDELTNIAKEQGLAMQKFNGVGEKEDANTQFKKAYEQNKDAFKAIAEGTGSRFAINLGVTSKASADMSLSNITAATGFLSSFDNEVGRFVRRRPFLRDIIRVSGVDNAYVEWMDQASADGAVATVAEGAAKPKIDFDLTPRKMPVEVIAGYVTISKQALADYKQMSALINDELRQNVELALDANILTGNGTSPNLKGISSYATAYANTGFAALVDNANESDLWNIMAAQVAAANGMATHILMHPTDVAKFRSLRKDTTGATTYPWWLGENMSFMGMQIVENTGVTVNTCYVIDANVCRLAMREDFNVTIGLDGNNFTKNQVTILGEMRAAHYVKENDKPKLIYCSGITAALAALEKP